jgi:TRAP-type C4-dicarboxylate transport system permease small subunit
MRKFLDNLYRLSGGIAAGFIALICLTVVLQVGANIIDKFFGWYLGAPLGLIVPSYAEFTGFFLTAATFFGLAYTLRSGTHIRVSLIISRLNGRLRKAFEIWCLSAAAALVGYFAWFAANLVRESYVFGDLSVGMVALPIWIPQIPMMAGLAVLFVALVDDLIAVLSGRAPSYEGKGEGDDPAGPNPTSAGG